MNKLWALPLCACIAVVFMAGCSKDIMYGPHGEIVKMKSPKNKLKIKHKGDKVEIDGVRGIGGRSRVRIPPVPVETGEGSVGISDVMIHPPSAPVVPVVPVRERVIEVEQTDIVY